MRIAPKIPEIPRKQISVNPDTEKLPFHPQKNTSLLAPIVVRKLAPTQYEVVIGHSRFFAAKKSKLKLIPCLLFKGTAEEAAKLRKLEWIYDIGENGILRHPEAYNFYKEKKAELLPKKLPKVLLTDEAWIDFLRDAVSEAFVAVFDTIFKNADDRFKEDFREFFANDEEFDSMVSEYAEAFAKESFKKSDLEDRSWKAIDRLCDLLFRLSDEEQDWADGSTFNLPLPKKLQFPFSREDALRIFNCDTKTHLAIFQNRTKAMLKHAGNSGLITGMNSIKKTMGKSTQIVDPLNFHLSQSFIPEIKSELENHKGEDIDTVLQSKNFKVIFLDEFLTQLNNSLFILYEKIRADENKGVDIDEEYMSDCFDDRKIAVSIYSRLIANENQRGIVETINDVARNLFVSKILENCTQAIRISHFILKRTNEAKNNFDLKKELQSIFSKIIRRKCESLEVHYEYLDSPHFYIKKPIELIGNLLLMHRSYRHYIKQETQSKHIFLKRKIRFCTIEHHIGKDRVLEVADGASEFMFTFDFGSFGKVFPILKTFSTGNFDYHVQLFGSYTKSLTKKELEDTEEDIQKKSLIAQTLSAMMKEAKPPFGKKEIPKIMAEWISSLMKLKPLLHMERFTDEVKRKILKTLIVFTFTLMFIEGRRNPGAFALHGLALKELLENPNKTLNNSIVDGRFVMTPTESKASGQLLQRFFRPKCLEDLNFSYLQSDVAERSFAIINDLKPDLENTETTLQKMFGIPL